MAHSPILIGVDSRQGSREFMADAVDCVTVEGTGAVGVAVVDGIGNNAAVADAAKSLAWSASRVAVRNNPTLAVLHASSPLADTSNAVCEPDVVMVVALAEPGESTVVAHVGDCRAYGWDGERLRQYTVDHTTGQRLRFEGAPEQQARRRDNVVSTTVGRAVVGAVRVVTIPDPWTVLVSDGVYKPLSEEELVRILSEFDATPQACATALVDAAAAAATSRGSYVDDAAAAVIFSPRPVSAVHAG